MSSSASLAQRLQALNDSYKATLSLVSELQRFPNGTTQTDDLDEQRLDLANSCHQSLKDAEESLELLRQEVDDYESHAQQRRRINSPRNEEQERNAASIARLTEDVRGARGAFRRAQLQSKKNLDNRKQKEREQLFANRRAGVNGSPVPGRQRGQEKLTQDELTQNAANDVTKALRRTHDLLSNNLQQSQFAQQTLDESQEQLRSLSERYTGTTDMLQTSRTLVKTLVTSQKSDTWYLQTSVYILLVTIAWLVFRRLIYGPAYWLAWMPLKLVWWGFAFVFSGSAATTEALVGKNSSMVMQSSTSLGSPATTPAMFGSHHVIPEQDDAADSEDDPLKSPEVLERLKQMINEAKEGTVLVDDPEQPRNSKKRMMEEQVTLRDEL